VKLPYFVDEHFWQPSTPKLIDENAFMNVEGSKRPMICAAGLEFRDYPTLLSAVKDLDVNVHIAAGSAPAFYLAATGSRRTTSADLPNLPANVSVGRYDYAGMRQLYSAARFVVIPLCQKDAPAGATVILEAMAMGKAVITTGTRGQTDVLRDPRNNGRGLVEREWWPGFLDAPGVSETLGSLPTGFYVSPGDVNELRNSIQYLLDHPEVADEMGRNGQRVAKEYFNLDAFAQRFAAAIRGETHPELVYNPQFQHKNALAGEA
jgi:glycosyltransferase involved in cell wall biosynthesis